MDEYWERYISSSTIGSWLFCTDHRTHKQRESLERSWCPSCSLKHTSLCFRCFQRRRCFAKWSLGASTTKNRRPPKWIERRRRKQGRIHLGNSRSAPAPIDQGKATMVVRKLRKTRPAYEFGNGFGSPTTYKVDYFAGAQSLVVACRGKLPLGQERYTYQGSILPKKTHCKMRQGMLVARQEAYVNDLTMQSVARD